jgi:GT2 family glycosyltransferase
MRQHENDRIALRPAGVRGPAPAGPGASAPPQRPTVRGKFLYTGVEKFWIRGVTYGTFRPRPGGDDYPAQPVLDADFAAMAAAGLNAVRTYTVPPRRLLDAALAHGLRVFVGLPWEQHVTFLDERRRARDIVARVAAGVRACAGHPAVLAYAVGNEIPAPIVRWYGARRIERFVAELWEAAKAEDPDGLVTYVNYPTTEYLELPFLDFACFNVYLERPEPYRAYLARLHNLAGDRPLVMTEIGLDSRRHGPAAQADALEWQLRATFAAGCAGAFVFAWTDEWYRGGLPIEDWDFGLTDRRRRPKPALHAVRRVLEEVPFPKAAAWPRVSVIVCSYNGGRTIAECLESLLALEYPNFEIIVVDDGSTDATAEIARRFGVRLISTPNRGLSSARNTGLAAATGEVVAYIDDDAYADPHWLTYAVSALLGGRHAAVGGPNVPPPGDGPVAAAVARAPGGPIHVLVNDTEAEHIPGCNMVFRRDALRAVGGFDPQFRTAGDDVDVCWRLQARGESIGFHPAALVWHHRRNSVRAYWRQQVGYGRAEALLERKWPDKYNGVGHATWTGRIYGPAAVLAGRGRRIYHGTWGAAPFQSVYQPTSGWLGALASLPEWPLLVGALLALGLLGPAWPPLFWSLPLAALAAALPVAHAALAAARSTRALRGRQRWVIGALTFGLHLLQPLARLRGRLRGGLVPWRSARTPFAPPRPARFTTWTETWEPPADRLARLEAALLGSGCAVHRGDDWSRWDLEVTLGIAGRARLTMVVEEHGRGRQLARFRVWPRPSVPLLAVAATLLALAAGAAASGAWPAAAALGAAASALGGLVARACGVAVGAFLVARAAAETPGREPAVRQAA